MFSGLFLICWLGIVFVVIASLWIILTKANKPGWAAIVPIYNMIVIQEIIGRPWWWIFLFFIPLVNVVIAIMTAMGLAKAFGKGIGTAIGLLLLPIIFYPMLAFGDARYQGPSAGAAVTA